MTAFGCVPRASVCPCARCVEAKTSPSSIAWQTPTATASWPIATCRKPGSSPARNRSSTFSSKRRIEQHLAQEVAQRLLAERALLLDLGHAAAVYVLRREPRRRMARCCRVGLPDGWRHALRLELRRSTKPHARAAALLGPLGRTARPATVLRFASRARDGSAQSGPMRSRVCCARLDDARHRRHAARRLGIRRARGARPERPRTTLAASWDALLATLPAGLERPLRRGRARPPATTSSARAAAAAPLNPRRDGDRAALRFRCGAARRLRRRAGDGAPLPRALRRRGDPRRGRGCCASLSDTRPVGTQGPVWHVDGQTV